MSPDDLHILQALVHYSLHFLFPGLIAWLFFRPYWKKAWLIMLATMLVDLDHLLADPLFDPNRCSIGFHPLHSYYAIAAYVILFFFPPLRIVAVGLLLHMFTDYQDCWWM
jgi:predicted cobalt transporter CbtA